MEEEKRGNVLVSVEWEEENRLFENKIKAMSWIEKELKDDPELVDEVHVYLPINNKIVEHRIKSLYILEEIK